MVRVWFGNESDGLKRDRLEHVLTLVRPSFDLEDTKRFYCAGLGFYVTGMTSGRDGRLMYLASKRLPSVAFGFRRTDELKPGEMDNLRLDIGVWELSEWEDTVGRMTTLGFAPTASKLANPHQKWVDFTDPTGGIVRYTYTRPPVSTGRQATDA